MLTGLITVGLLTGCTQQQQDNAAPPEGTAPSVQPSSSAAPELPPAPEPGAEADCPYLDRSFIANANGQRVSQVRISAEEPSPSCFFYALSGKPQLTVRVYTGESAVAEGLVDQAAPVESSNPAQQPAGWEGGYLSNEDGAVYAVAKEGNAVIVTTNQQQSVKARTVAEEAISALGI
ncbi:uncharacterized protein DUF2020 [Amycolatopsis cihanbeyliensis]|uniref:Uncharacterized protein DUF2020 n=2 Tax=Amycolatopsis cihanbeyliensis TaxID=1128664 RepID=A0A542DLE2_AMYCI|nr:uncharacterized protein DUF2020 [Amycolatopsis cihanbeyliensis]